MRQLWIVGGFALVAAVGMGLSAGTTRAQPDAGGKDANHRKVTVSGTATVSVKPDTARVSFAVKATGADFKAATAECDKKAAAIEKAIKDLKIDGLEIKKGPLHFTQLPGGFAPPGPGGIPPMPGGMGVPPPPPMPPMPGGMPPGAPGWMGGAVEVSRTFSVIATFGKEGGAGKFEDIVPVADKLLAAVVGAGATDPPVFTTQGTNPYNFSGIPNQTQNRVEFYRSSLTSVRQEAIKLAVADALANAKIAAGAANLTTKDIVSITDQTQYGGPFGMGGAGAVNTGRGEVLGEMELTMTLSVTFSY